MPPLLGMHGGGRWRVDGSPPEHGRRGPCCLHFTANLVLCAVLLALTHSPSSSHSSPSIPSPPPPPLQFAWLAVTTCFCIGLLPQLMSVHVPCECLCVCVCVVVCVCVCVCACVEGGGGLALHLFLVVFRLIIWHGKSPSYTCMAGSQHCMLVDRSLSFR